jgi:hypothetical protein
VLGRRWSGCLWAAMIAPVPAGGLLDCLARAGRAILPAPPLRLASHRVATHGSWDDSQRSVGAVRDREPRAQVFVGALQDAVSRIHSDHCTRPARVAVGLQAWRGTRACGRRGRGSTSRPRASSRSRLARRLDRRRTTAAGCPERAGLAQRRARRRARHRTRCAAACPSAPSRSTTSRAARAPADRSDQTPRHARAPQEPPASRPRPGKTPPNATERGSSATVKCVSKSPRTFIESRASLRVCRRQARGAKPVPTGKPGCLTGQTRRTS